MSIAQKINIDYKTLSPEILDKMLPNPSTDFFQNSELIQALKEPHITNSHNPIKSTKELTYTYNYTFTFKQIVEPACSGQLGPDFCSYFVNRTFERENAKAKVIVEILTTDTMKITKFINHKCTERISKYCIMDSHIYTNTLFECPNGKLPSFPTGKNQLHDSFNLHSRTVIHFNKYNCPINWKESTFDI